MKGTAAAFCRIPPVPFSLAERTARVLAQGCCSATEDGGRGKLKQGDTVSCCFAALL